MTEHRIYKYDLNPEVIPITLQVPGGYRARVLHTDVQHDSICVWIEVDPTEPKLPVRFSIFGTGWIFEYKERGDGSPARDYIGTVLLAGGDLVFHVYREPEQEVRDA